MRIEHIALWTLDLERLSRFYETYFEAFSGSVYVNESKGFRSIFLSFKNGPRLEIMTLPGVHAGISEYRVGYAHLAFSVGSKEKVDGLTRKLSDDGFQVVSDPRKTGDGYYESVILDPDGNQIEITV